MQGVLYYFDEIEVSPLPMYLALGAGILLGIFFFIRARERLGLQLLLMIWTGAFALGCFGLAFGGRILPLAVFLWFLTRYGYDQTLAKGLQTASAETGVLLGWGFVPGVLLLLCFVILLWYQLHGEKWETIKESLMIHHQEKEKRFLEKHGITFE
jgi:Na+/melibiose symporter-like transporter